MERLEKWLGEAPLWKVTLCSWILLGTALTFGFRLLGLFSDPSEWSFSLQKCILAGLATGFMLAMVLTMTISMMRNSSLFWEGAKELEKLIEEASDKESLDRLYEGKFKELRSKAYPGHPHSQELTRLFTIMKTKRQYV